MSEQINQHAATADFEFDALRQAANYRRALIAESAPYLGGKVIEIGAGIGQMTELLEKIPAVTMLQSVEPDARFSSQFKANRPESPLIRGTIADVPGTDWNGLVSINVLEHIEHDQAELAAYARMLGEKQGLLVLFVPARPELYGLIDKDFGHFRRYTKAELRKKLTQAGFTVEHMRYYNIVGYFAWWLNFCLLKQRNFNQASVRLFDRLIFPVVHALETHICPPPFGQSLLVVARAGRSRLS